MLIQFAPHEQKLCSGEDLQYFWVICPSKKDDLRLQYMNANDFFLSILVKGVDEATPLIDIPCLSPESAWIQYLRFLGGAAHLHLTDYTNHPQCSLKGILCECTSK